VTTTAPAELDVNDPAAFDLLPELERQIIAEWVRLALIPSRRTTKPRTSYGLKHDLEADLGLYITNGALKGALLASGYDPTPRTAAAINWAVYAQPSNPCAKRWKWGSYRLSHLPEDATPTLTALLAVAGLRRRLE